MTAYSVIAACAPNLRDVGGLASEDGRRVRPGILYRSSHLAPPAEEVEGIRALGIKAVIDLRSPRERSSAPNTFLANEGVEIAEFDITADFRSGVDPLDHLRNDPGEAGAKLLMKATYKRLPRAAAPALRAAADRIIAGRVPLLVHCTAGKDRTGFVCAMLLIAAGVPAEAAMSDYLQSGGRSHPSVIDATRQIMAHGGLELSDAALGAINGVHRDYLGESFAVIALDYGGPDAYFEALGIDRARLREALLV
jgi:protein-tyrosine phosphatase